MGLRSNCYEVAPLSTEDIKYCANSTRGLADILGFVNHQGAFDIVRFMELGNINVSLSDGQNVPLCLEVVDDNELPDAEAKTFPNGTIKVRESVYDLANLNDGRSRFTLAHELFHAVVHCRQFAMCREATEGTRCYRNSEWQADMFAGNLLFPDELVKEYENLPEDEVSLKLGISKSCARVRRAQCNKNKSSDVVTSNTRAL